MIRGNFIQNDLLSQERYRRFPYKKLDNLFRRQLYHMEARQGKYVLHECTDKRLVAFRSFPSISFGNLILCPHKNETVKQKEWPCQVKEMLSTVSEHLLAGDFGEVVKGIEDIIKVV